MTAEKACTKCGEVKPLEGFYRRTRSLDGRESACKACRLAQMKANGATLDHAIQRQGYRRRNRERRNAYNREWARRNPERVRETGWRAVYTERVRRFGLPKVIGVADQAVTVRNVVTAFGDRCFYRYDGCTGEFSQLDHKRPVAAGGPHTLDNVRPSCRSCNIWRRDYHLRVAWTDPDAAEAA